MAHEGYCTPSSSNDDLWSGRASRQGHSRQCPEASLPSGPQLAQLSQKQGPCHLLSCSGPAVELMASGQSSEASL